MARCLRAAPFGSIWRKSAGAAVRAEGLEVVQAVTVERRRSILVVALQAATTGVGPSVLAIPVLLGGAGQVDQVVLQATGDLAQAGTARPVVREAAVQAEDSVVAEWAG